MRFDVGPEVAVDDVRQVLAAFQSQAELAADEAGGAVRGNERGAGEGFLSSGGAGPRIRALAGRVRVLGCQPGQLRVDLPYHGPDGSDARRQDRRIRPD